MADTDKTEPAWTAPTTKDVAKIDPAVQGLGVHDEGSWNALVAQAHVVANSNIVPKAYRRQPDDVIAAALTGREFGWGTMTSLRYIAIIDGNPSFSAEAILGMVRQRGHNVTGTSDRKSATITARRKDSGDEMTVTYDLHDALSAGLIDSINEDGTARKRTQQGNRDVWEKHTHHMLWARAVTTICRRLFPEVTLGAGYTPEEIDGPAWVDPTPGPATAATTTGEVTETPADVRTADIIRDRYELLPVEAKMKIDDWLDKSGAPTMEQLSNHDDPKFLAQVAKVIDKAIEQTATEPFETAPAVPVEDVPADEVEVLDPPTTVGDVEDVESMEDKITAQVEAAKAKQAVRAAEDKADDEAIRAEFEADAEPPT